MRSCKTKAEGPSAETAGGSSAERPVKPAGGSLHGTPMGPDGELLGAKKKALSLLEIRDRTESELRGKLREKGFSDEAVEGALEYVKSFRYVDDRRFAESFIRAHSGKKSILELKMLLREKGVSSELCEEMLDTSEVDEAETVKALFMKKYGKGTSDDPKLMEKALRYFAGKGYGFDAIREGIARALSLEEQEEK